MPFTPLHLIPGFVIYLLFFPYVDLLALTVATIFIDVEPTVNLFILNTRPLHGILHSLLGALFVSAPILLFCCRLLETRSNALVKLFGYIRWNPAPRPIPLKMTISSIYIGIASHLILDYWTHEALPVSYPMDPSGALWSEAFDLWSFDLTSYLLLRPHLLLYASGIILIPITYVMGRWLHKEEPFTRFP